MTTPLRFIALILFLTIGTGFFASKAEACGSFCYPTYGNSINYTYPQYPTYAPSYGYPTYFPTISYPRVSYSGYNNFYQPYTTYNQPYYGNSGSFWGGFAGGIVGAALGSAFSGNTYSNTYIDNSYNYNDYGTFYGY